MALTGRSSQLRIYLDTRLSRFSVTQALGRSATVKCHETLDNNNNNNTFFIQGYSVSYNILAAINRSPVLKDI